MEYDGAFANKIEKYWQDIWKKTGAFNSKNPKGQFGDFIGDKKKFYILDMFPYPSGYGLHVGHPLGYIASDIYARFLRMEKYNVLYTMGFDSFGLPAEQYAIETGTDPRITTERNINHYIDQISRLGISHDERRRVSTSDVQFYKWTQWIFIKIYNSWYDDKLQVARTIDELIIEFRDGIQKLPNNKNWDSLSKYERYSILNKYRLVYLDEEYVNWCPKLGTVLADEEVTNDNLSVRGEYPVVRKLMKQWKMRTTKYADCLLDGLSQLDWPDHIKSLQANWIGRSSGHIIKFKVYDSDQYIDIFTTRLETIFGVSFIIISAEYKNLFNLLPKIWNSDHYQLNKFASFDIDDTPRKTYDNYIQMVIKTHDKNIIFFSGIYCVHPLTNVKVPVFISSVVVPHYGTGAVMCVPAHNNQDYSIAKQFALPITQVISIDKDIELPYTKKDGYIINSKNSDINLNNLNIVDARDKIFNYLNNINAVQTNTTYRMRDWIFDRQRYWGEPFPIVYDNEDIPHVVPESCLPIELPEYQHNIKTSNISQSPLCNYYDWVNCELDIGEGKQFYRRETNTMPQWAGSSWYYIRYLDTQNNNEFVDSDIERYWLYDGVDLYIGGAEYAISHLLYARFWHKILYDLGYLSHNEPFRKLCNQGYVEAYAYKTVKGDYVPAKNVIERNNKFYYNNQEVERLYGKMGKSLKNSIEPDEICDIYGADTLRLYEMYLAPLDVSRLWDTKNIIGIYRFLQKVWRNFINSDNRFVSLSNDIDDKQLLFLHKSIKNIREALMSMKFNIGIARLIELNTYISKLKDIPRLFCESLILMLSPFAPHISEELWHRLGYTDSVFMNTFPQYDSDIIMSEESVCALQVNGKKRAIIKVPRYIEENELRNIAFSNHNIQKWIKDKKVINIFIKSPSVVNFIVS